MTTKDDDNAPAFPIGPDAMKKIAKRKRFRRETWFVPLSPRGEVLLDCRRHTESDIEMLCHTWNLSSGPDYWHPTQIEIRELPKRKRRNG